MYFYGEYCGLVLYLGNCHLMLHVKYHLSYRYILNIDVHKLHENKNNLLLNRFNFEGDLYIHIPL